MVQDPYDMDLIASPLATQAIRNYIKLLDPDKSFYKKLLNYKVVVIFFMKLTSLGAIRSAFSLAHHEVLLVLG